jgi:DNA/RNA endonuclease YhcR with UshA esterase domain
MAPVWAHHSHGNYDIAKWTTLEGTVKELHLVNPHSFLHLQIKDSNGKVATWALEGSSAVALKNKGISRETFKPGDAVKVRCHLLKDGGNGCLLGFVTPLHGDATRGH